MKMPSATKVEIPKKSKDLCNGCYNNDYNYGLGSSKECWSYKSARSPIAMLLIPVDRRPPYIDWPTEYRLKCYNQQRYASTTPDSLTSDGYWKY